METLRESSQHFIAPGQLLLTENALGNPDLIQVSRGARCNVTIADLQNFPLNDLEQYPVFTLLTTDIKLNGGPGQYYIYIVVPTASNTTTVNATIGYSTTAINLTGHDADGNLLGHEHFRYYPAGTVSAQGGNPDAAGGNGRVIQMDLGRTPPSVNLPGNMSDYDKIFQIDKVDPSNPASWLLTILAHIKSMVVRSLTVTRELIFGTGKSSRSVTGVAVSADAVTGEKVSDSVLATTAWANAKFEDMNGKYIRKDQPDSTPFHVGFENGITVDGRQAQFNRGAQFGESFAGGLPGTGGRIDGEARGELRSLKLWEWLEVPELRFNSVKVWTGIDWQCPGGGIIESVTPDVGEDGSTLDTGVAILKLEEGQYGAVDVDDIVMGIWHMEDSSLNATETTDDSKGNFTFAGFATSYFRIVEVSGANNETIRYSLRPGYDVHPQPQMHFACYGNFTDKERQTSTYRTTTYTRRLWNQNTWEIGVQNIAAQDGDLSNLNVHGLQMQGYSAYLNSVYFTGTIKQVKPDGTPVITANDRGAWQAGKYGYYDRVSHVGCLWLCVNEAGTEEEPSESSADWLKQVDKGQDGSGGSSVIVADLDNEMDGVALTHDGKVADDTELITNVWMSYGESKMDITSIESVAPEHISVSGDVATGKVTVSIGKGTELPGNTDVSLNITASYGGKSYQRKLVFTILGVRAAKDGEDAVIYRLAPSVSMVKVDKDGYPSVYVITCKRQEYSASGGTKDSDVGEIYMILDGNQGLGYKENNEVNVSSFHESLTFQYRIDGKVVDIATIPKIRDGVDGADGEPGAPGEPGEPGKDSVSYKLMVIPPVIKINKHGDPSSYNFRVRTLRITAEGTFDLLDGKVMMSIDGGVEEKYPDGYELSHRIFETGIVFNYYVNNKVVDTTSLVKMYDGVDGADGQAAEAASNIVFTDLDNETESIALNYSGQTASSVTLTTRVWFSLGTKEIPLTKVDYEAPSYVSVSSVLSTGEVSFRISQGVSFPEKAIIPLTFTGALDGETYQGRANFTINGVRASGSGSNATLYKAQPFSSVIMVDKDGNCSPNVIGCQTQSKTTGSYSNTTQGTVRVSKDGGAEETYFSGNAFSVTSLKKEVKFIYYINGEVVDIETVPVIKDYKQGYQNCVIRKSIWNTGVEYRNDELELAENRYLDIALVEDDTSSVGYSAYRCKLTHTSSSLTKPIPQGNYWWEPAGVETTLALITLIIAKDASIDFLQGNQLLIKSPDDVIELGLTGGGKGSNGKELTPVRIWVGSENPDNAPFRVLKDGTAYATRLHISGDSTFGGKLDAVEGTFKSLVCADGEGNELILSASALGSLNPSIYLKNPSGKTVFSVDSQNYPSTGTAINLFRYDTSGNETNSVLIHSNGLIKCSMPDKSITIDPQGITFTKGSTVTMFYPATRTTLICGGGNFREIAQEVSMIWITGGTNYIYLPNPSVHSGRCIFFKLTSGIAYVGCVLSNKMLDAPSNSPQSTFNVKSTIAFAAVSSGEFWNIFYCG